MSVIFVVAPAVVVGWPILCGAVASVAGSLGYKILSDQKELTSEKNTENQVDISLTGSEIVSDSMKRESQFVISNGDVTATFRRAADGRCTVHVAGQNKTDEELTALGNQIIGRVTQQYAYNKVVTELKHQGFTISNEEVANDQTIRIRVCKYV